MYLKDSCFLDCWKVSSVVPAFKNVEERSAAKNHHPVSLLSVVSKFFQKLVNNRVINHLEKCGLFSDFQDGFRSARSTADLLTIASDRTTRFFSTWYIQDFWQGLACWFSSQTFKPYGISGQIFGLISSFLSNRLLLVVLDGSFSQKYPLNAGVLQGSIFGPTLFLL